MKRREGHHSGAKAISISFKLTAVALKHVHKYQLKSNVFAHLCGVVMRE